MTTRFYDHFRRFYPAGGILVLCFASVATAASSAAAHAETAISGFSRQCLQLRRFEPPVAALRDVFGKRLPDGELVDLIAGSDARVRAFSLEALAREYRDLNPRVFPKMRGRFRELVRAIGAHDLNVAMLEDVARKIPDLPPAVVADFEARKRASRAEFLKFLRDNDWVGRKPGKDRLSRIERRLLEQDWPGPKKDRRELIDSFARQARHVQKSDFDMNDLDEGLHKLRRQLRWLSLYFDSTRGAVKLEAKACPVAAYARLVPSEAAVARIKRIDESVDAAVKRPIRLPRCLYIALLDAVERLGDAKDTAEQVRALAESLRRTGQARDESAATAAALAYHRTLPKHVEDPVAQAQSIYDDLREHELLKELRRAFERQR